MNKLFKLGWDAASHDEDRSWAVLHGGEEAGKGWDAYWAEVGEPE